ncbi:family 78 glycoside hydrolase catalytic domain [Lacticaseibacillus paracasei]|uniref:family 78 glycoside hydrolase catalytic domain n=1 Tax=Lacticaseibacillus paracasei TaxID=1597 RepID=UPI003DA8AF83
MNELLNHFITSANQTYQEGRVIAFTQQFSLAQAVSAVALQATALGVYVLEIDGQRVSDEWFAPGYTYYPKRLDYQTYHVDLPAGTHELRAYLAQGWYSGRYTFDNQTGLYGQVNAIAWRLDLPSGPMYSDQTVTEWTSPYRYAGFYDGEVIDATLAITPLGHAVAYAGPLPAQLTPSTTAVRLQQTMPVQKAQLHGDETILDFGQNFAGIVAINLDLLPQGATITVRHAERLTKAGALYTANLRQAKATLQYTKGEAGGWYLPQFTYMGFRYVSVAGAAYQPGLIKAYVLHTQMTRTGYFECGNAQVARLYQNQLWSQRSNYLSVPTDCPQRDERMGYTGDAQVYALSGAYNYDTEAFMQQFVQDMVDSQADSPQGYIGSTVPATKPMAPSMLSMLGWGSAISLIPEMLAQQFGDTQTLMAIYPNLKRYVDFVISQMHGHDLWLSPNLGDWLMPGKDIAWMAMHNGEVSNAFVIHDLRTLTQLAQRLNKPADAKHYAQQLKASLAAYQAQFMHDDGTMKADYQGAEVMALALVVTDQAQRQPLLRQLVADVQHNGLNTGFFATQHLLPLLVEAGAAHLAYDVLLNPKQPGWLFEVANGATTIWERWDALQADGTVNDSAVGDDNMVSFNHYAFGSVAQFLYQNVLGIQPAAPGFARVLIKPIIDERLGRAAGKYLSRHGAIAVAWRYVDAHTVAFDIQTPTATRLILPTLGAQDITAGHYQYTIDLEAKS